MEEMPVDFYLDQHSIEIVNRLENIGKKFKRIASELRRAETTLEEDRKEEIFEKIKIDVRIRQ